MELQLYKWNGNQPKIERPSLNDLLNYGQPSAITLPLKKEQRVPDEAVLINWKCPWFSTNKGIRVIDYDNKQTHFLGEFDFEDGNRTFKKIPGAITDWSIDKYRSRANWYRLEGQPQELIKEFEKEGLRFEE